MINIKFNFKAFIQGFLYLCISILIFISSSNIVFSKGLNKNLKILISPEEKLAIKYCDSIKKDIFNGLNKEELLKYEYYFSSLKIPNNKNPEVFFNNFNLNVKTKCTYELTKKDKQEFISYIKKFLNK